MFFTCEKCKLTREQLIKVDKNNPGPILIRGLCVSCAPQLHNDRQFMYKTMSKLSKAFETKTGKTDLADWYGFENFMAEELPKMDEGERFIAILEEKNQGE